MTDQALSFIKKSNYFDGLSDQQLKRVLDYCESKKFAKGQTLIKESDRGEFIFLITKCRVDVSVSLVGGNKSENIAGIGDGEIVGEMILLGKSRRSANVVAKDDVEVITWRAADMISLFKEDAEIGYIVMKNIAAHLAERLVAANNVLRNALTISTGSIF